MGVKKNGIEVRVDAHGNVIRGVALEGFENAPSRATLTATLGTYKRMLPESVQVGDLYVADVNGRGEPMTVARVDSINRENGEVHSTPVWAVGNGRFVGGYYLARIAG